MINEGNDFMLELKNIKKSYKTGDFVQQALKDTSIEFRKNELIGIVIVIIVLDLFFRLII